MFRKLKKAYVSQIDRFLAQFNHEQPALSLSQKAEVKKFERIARLRDNPAEREDPTELWKDF